jgi:hypothetical protein
MRKPEHPKSVLFRSELLFKRMARRKRKMKKRKASAARHCLTMKRYADANGGGYLHHKYKPFISRHLHPKPALPLYFKFLGVTPEAFDRPNKVLPKEIRLHVPDCFSLIEKSAESFQFLRLLFDAIINGQTEIITIDYEKCERIDVDASICMDLLIAEYNGYRKRCASRGYDDVWPTVIGPENYKKPAIEKVLFSIGAYRNLKGLQIKYNDVIPLPVLINSQYYPDCWSKNELDLTKIVEYIKECLQRTGHSLTTDAETEFYKVIGEIMSNAEEHSTMPHRFAIGFFQEHHTDEHFGIFNFSIFNFGDTIYNTFKSENCKNQRVVEQMQALSAAYTKRGLLKKQDFEEETLWTLYALQEGVTSKEKKRGNGSIQYIENFFRLKGDMQKDEVSKLVIMSGNTRILFDGTYKIFKKPSKDNKRPYRMITFNGTEDIQDKPDKKFVTFAPHYFPGTMISARILLKFDNTNSVQNEP